MYLQEQVALRMAQERMADAVREAEQWRAALRERPAVRIRLGRSLVRLGHWLWGRRSLRFRNPGVAAGGCSHGFPVTDTAGAKPISTWRGSLGNSTPVLQAQQEYIIPS